MQILQAFPHIPLRYLLLIVLGGFAILVVPCSYLATRPVVVRHIEAHVRDEMRADLSYLRDIMLWLLRTDNLEGLRSVMSALKARPEHELTVVTTATGQILAATRPAMRDTPWSSEQSDLDPTLLAQLRSLRPLAVRLAADGVHLSGYAELCLPGEALDVPPALCGFLYTRHNIQARKATALQALRMQAIEHGLGALLAALVLWSLVHLTVTRQVERLIAVVRRLSAGDWSARVGFTGHGELARVGQALDSMAQTVTESQMDNARLLAALQRQTADLHQSKATLEAEVHERRSVEGSFRERDVRMRAIVETVLEGIITIDEQGIIDTYNAAAEQLFGYPAAAVLGQNIRMLMPSPYREAHDNYLEHYLRTGERKIIGIGREVLGLRKDGTVFPMALAVSEMYVGNRRMFTGVVSDISARKQAENALRQANAVLEQRVWERTAALEEANEEVKRFAYIVSHDLRAPLVNLKGFAGELRLAQQMLTGTMEQALAHLAPQEARAVQRALSEDIPEALDFIEASVTRMDSLVRAVLQLSRLGRRELVYEPLDTTALVQETLQTLGHQIAQQQVQVTVGELPKVRADRTSMVQIFANLLTNAVHYLEPGRPGKITISAESQPQVATFHIRDNGRGIAPSDIPRIFEPFRRVGRQDVPGEGMGLAYVRTLVRRHGGEITCQSTLGVGTTCTFTIAPHCPGDRQHA